MLLLSSNTQEQMDTVIEGGRLKADEITIELFLSAEGNGRLKLGLPHKRTTSQGNDVSSAHLGGRRLVIWINAVEISECGINPTIKL